MMSSMWVTAEEAKKRAIKQRIKHIPLYLEKPLKEMVSGIKN